MNTLTQQTNVTKVWFDSDNLWVAFTDGRQLATPLSYFPRLLHANKEQKENFIISGGGTGIHWEAIDEDISVEGLILGVPDKTHG